MRISHRLKLAKVFFVACLRFLLSLFEGKGSSATRHECSQLMVLSQRLHRIQGMIGQTEKAYLYWYTKHIFTGEGTIVDLGSWLGGTTISLAMGLEDNKRLTHNKLIHSYDEFVWGAWMNHLVQGTGLEGRYQPGDSFLDEFKHRTSPWQQYVRSCPGDLAKVGWSGSSIEFLLIDAMKSWEAAIGVVQNFFPALIPGVSLILHQDFAHWYTAWIHPIQYRFRDYFEPKYDIPLSSSVVFQLCRPLPLDLLMQEWSVTQFSPAEVDSAFAYSLDIVCSEKRPNIIAAKAMYFLHQGQLDRATKEIAYARSQGYSFDSDLPVIEQQIANTWQGQPVSK